MPTEISENLSKKAKDRYVASTDYIHFLGIIVAGAFTVLAILLALSDLTELFSFGYLFYSILFLVLSIFFSFESLGGYIWCKRAIVLDREETFYYYYGNTFWYWGIFTFILSIIYLLLNVGIVLIALISYFLLFFFSVLDWVDDFFNMSSQFGGYIVNRRNKIEEEKEKLKKVESQTEKANNKDDEEKKVNRDIFSYKIRIFKTWIFRILLYLSIFGLFIIYIGWLGGMIIVKLIQNIIFSSMILIFFYLFYAAIWGVKFYFLLRT